MQSNNSSYKLGEHPDLPAPAGTVGPIAWVRSNLFSSPTNIVLTILVFWFLYKLIPGSLNWFFLDAVFSGEDRNACIAAGDGACWAFVGQRFKLFTYGFYPEPERWRVNLSFIMLCFAIVPVLFDKTPFRKYGLYYAMAFPFIGGWLLIGGSFLGIFSLPVVATSEFGGIMLTLVIGVTGIAFSLPIGILLALGRQSNLPIIRIFCIGFIEFMRGVPLITLLFVASTMLSYFLPPGTKFDLLLRVLIMVTLFASAYMAEVIRGGLQAIPKGQVEAADALGLKYWPTMRLIVLPQALKISIPGIVNTFIGLYKDSTLVIIIGLLDPLGIGQASLADTKWTGLSTEVYIFVAIFFFISCFSMSRYSLYLEGKLETGHKR
ncbi:MAG: general L-amino acid transport system permease protein [Parasphingorhabdus sp.]|jgi:general L-amino acid transport system permease protein